MLTIFPFLRNLPGDPFKCHKIKQLSDFMMDEFQKMTDEHKEELDISDEPKDFIDAYLRELQKVKGQESTTFSGLSLYKLSLSLK